MRTLKIVYQEIDASGKASFTVSTMLPREEIEASRDAGAMLLANVNNVFRAMDNRRRPPVDLGRFFKRTK